MKPSRALLCTLLCAFTTVTFAAEPGQPAGRGKAVMLYFTKAFGSDQKQNREPLAFGLRLQQSSPLDSMPAVALLDARYSLGGRKTFALAGLNAFDSSDGSSSSEGPSLRRLKDHPGLTVTILAVSVLGISCATENWPCKGSSGYREPELETPNTPGN